MDKRMCINSLAPFDVTYAHKLDPSTAKGWATRVVKRSSIDTEEDKSEAITLTDLEALWGEERVAKGLQRGDARVRPDGLYERRSASSCNKRVVEDNFEGRMEAEVSGDVAAKIMDAVSMNEIKDWMNSGDEEARSVGGGSVGGGSARSVGGGKRLKKKKSDGFTPATAEDMKKVQHAYDVASLAVRQAKTHGKLLRQAVFIILWNLSW